MGIDVIFNETLESSFRFFSTIIQFSFGVNTPIGQIILITLFLSFLVSLIALFAHGVFNEHHLLKKMDRI